MYKKVELHEIPPFFVDTELDQQIIKNKATEFDKQRSEFGYPILRQLDKYKLRREFCEKYGFKLAFDSLISLEIYKQGRTREWLHGRIIEIPEFKKLSYISFCQKITGYGKMPVALKKEINQLLKIY